MLVAFSKVGKTTLGQALAAAVAMDRPFLDRNIITTRVLVIAAEDPPEYTAYLARSLDVTADRLTFYRAPILLNTEGLQRLCETIEDGHYGLVLIASWQAVDPRPRPRRERQRRRRTWSENVKTAARDVGIPWVIDAHSGKGEDQDDDADPIDGDAGRLLRLAGAADYILSLRYADGTFGTQRRLSGKGRFVTFAPLTLDFDAASSGYSVAGPVKDVTRETTWRSNLRDRRHH